ncbi:MAG: glycosyltransferase, partial [Chloroflexi bacterium]|nr:glycosyltransferase [Chloroflexota bacterium]
MVSKACVVGEYQKKLEELATFPDLALTVIVPPFWRDERGVLPLERAYTNGYTLRVEPLAFNGQFHLHFYPTLARVFRELQPDLVHLDEEPYNLATLLAQHYARRVGARSLFFTWQNLLRRYPLPFEWMQTRVFKQTDYAIAGSDQAARVLRAKNYRGPLSVLPQFGVNPEKFLPAQVAAKSFRIGFVGRLVEEKGLAVLLRALASLRGDWELRVLGRGPESEKLQTLTRELNIQNKISFDRPRPSTEMPT